MNNHRVVVTGLGCVTPIGINVIESWRNLLNGLSGIKNILSLPEWQHLHPQISQLPSHLAAPISQIPPNISSPKLPRSFLFAEMAAEEALKDARIGIESLRESVGVFLGCGMPGVDEIYENSNIIRQTPRRISPYFIPAILGNSPAGHVSRKFKLKGPISSPSSACATGSYAIGEAYRLLRDSNEEGFDVILSGATEAPLNPASFSGFSRIRSLSNSNSSPDQASRPFDLNRNGFVLGEGAGCLVLERLESALKRNAKIYAEVIGFGCTSDAHHPTAPDPSNYGAIKAIKSSLSTKITHKLLSVNAHATSTQLGDEIELSALEKSIDSSKLPFISVTSNKGSIGHLLGASGAVESIFSILSLHHRLIPSNRNLFNKIQTPFNLPTENIKLPADFPDISVLKTSFGFGGINVALLFKKVTLPG